MDTNGPVMNVATESSNDRALPALLRLPIQELVDRRRADYEAHERVPGYWAWCAGRFTGKAYLTKLRPGVQTPALAFIQLSMVIAFWLSIRSGAPNGTALAGFCLIAAILATVGIAYVSKEWRAAIPPISALAGTLELAAHIRWRRSGRRWNDWTDHDERRCFADVINGFRSEHMEPLNARLDTIRAKAASIEARVSTADGYRGLAKTEREKGCVIQADLLDAAASATATSADAAEARRLRSLHAECEKRIGALVCALDQLKGVGATILHCEKAGTPLACNDIEARAREDMRSAYSAALEAIRNEAAETAEAPLAPGPSRDQENVATAATPNA